MPLRPHSAPDHRLLGHACFSGDRRRGFTLSELLMSMTITSLTLAMVLPFFIFNLRSIFHGEQKLLINGDIRELTTTMMENAREANYFTLYQSFSSRTTPATVSVQRDANGDGSFNELDRRLAGDTGDFLVLVFTRNNAVYDSRYYDGIAGNEPANIVQVTRLVAYWIAPNRQQATNADGTTRHALYLLDTDQFKSSPTATSWNTSWGATFPVTLGPATTLESLLPPDSAAAAIDATYAELLVNDLSGRGIDGQNFLNFANRTVVFQTRVLHGNRAKRVTNTYNFAITPRG
jgi:prepilin-type N-terminal cleavage/methylation domain-containing protein